MRCCLVLEKFLYLGDISSSKVVMELSKVGGYKA